MRLRREAAELEPAGGAVVRERREVDPGREVLEPRVGERVRDAPVPAESAQRPAVARRMVVLRARQPVVDDEDRAARPACARRPRASRAGRAATRTRSPRASAPATHAAATRRPPRAPRRRAAARRQIRRRPRLRRVLRSLRRSRENGRPAAHRRLRSRSRRPATLPAAPTRAIRTGRDRPRAPVPGATRSRWRAASTGLGSTMRYRATGAPSRCKARQELDGQRAAARAELDDVAAARSCQQVGDAVCQAGGEQRRELRRRDEIAGGAEQGAGRHVVAEAGRIERRLHEFPERDPAAARRDARSQCRGHALALRGFLRRERRRRRARQHGAPAGRDIVPRSCRRTAHHECGPGTARRQGGARHRRRATRRRRHRRGLACGRRAGRDPLSQLAVRCGRPRRPPERVRADSARAFRADLADATACDTLVTEVDARLRPARRARQQCVHFLSDAHRHDHARPVRRPRRLEPARAALPVAGGGAGARASTRASSSTSATSTACARSAGTPCTPPPRRDCSC